MSEMNEGEVVWEPKWTNPENGHTYSEYWLMMTCMKDGAKQVSRNFKDGRLHEVVLVWPSGQTMFLQRTYLARVVDADCPNPAVNGGRLGKNLDRFAKVWRECHEKRGDSLAP